MLLFSKRFEDYDMGKEVYYQYKNNLEIGRDPTARDLPHTQDPTLAVMHYDA